MVVKRSTERKHGKMENLKLYTVTKPSSDGTFVTGDIIWLSENGDLNSCKGKVKSRLVLYTGASSKQNDVLYLNAATYLKRLSIVSNTPRPEIKQLLNENCNTSKPNLKTTSRKKPRKL